MGMYDTIQLIEPLPCYSCFSTIEDKLEENCDLREVDIAGKKLKIMRLHDGKGGIKSFQTKDMNCLMEHYWFPGFVPPKGDHYWGCEWEIDKDNPQPLSLIEICNKCDSSWDGELNLIYEKEDDVFITDSIRMRSDEKSSFISQEEQETEFYNIGFDNDSILVKPKIESSIRHYKQECEKFKSKIENYMAFFDSLNVEHKDIIKTSLDKILKDIGKIECKNKLVRAVNERDDIYHKFIYTESALEGGLIILYGKNKEPNVLELVSMSGVSTPEDFLKLFDFQYGWFFVDREKLTDRQILGSCCGIMGGPNYFLRKIKEIE